MALQVWLPLNGTLENKGLAGVTVTNNGATVNDNGKIGKCYQFGTSSSYMTLPASTMTSFTSEASICFWIKILSWNTSYATFFQAGLTSTPWTHYIFGFLRNNATSNCCFTISNSSTSSQNNYKTPDLGLNVWYHITLTYKTGHCCIYMNGILYNDYSTSIVPNFSGITKIAIGKGTNGSNYQTNCLLNDIRIYNHALSPKEVYEIAKGLVLHYKLDGNDIGITIPRNGGLIPDGVELYDYIQSSGTQWIDSEIIQGSNSRTILEYQQASSPDRSHLNRLFGARLGSPNRSYLVACTWSSAANLTFQYNSTTSYINSSYNNTDRHKLDLNKGTLTIDNNVVATIAQGNFTCPGTSLIFAYRDNTNIAGKSYIKVFRCEMYENEVLVRNFLPCTYLGEPGMWDTVENKFYRNQGTGQFTLGNKITLKEYEYLESTGTQWINTGTKFNVESDSCTVIFKGNDTANNGMIFASSSGTYFWFYYYSSNGIRVYAHNGSSQQGVSGYLARDTEKHTMKWENKHYFIDNDDKGTLSNTYGETTNNIWLFSYGGNGYPFKGRIYYTNIKQNNQLVRDFIPVSYNGTPGLWDKVEWKFYANAGTGSFTLGPEVTVQQDAPVFYDSSGYCNHGSITGALTTDSDSPRYTNSIQFGSDKLISTTASGPHILTMSIWAKDAGSTPTNGLMFKDHLGDMALGIQSGTLYSGKSSGKGAGNKAISTIGYTANIWHHWVMVNRDNTFYVYMDGQQVLSGTSGSWSAGTVTNALHIGGRSGSSPWPGKLSDFRAYATALSEEDILELYNTSAFVTDNGVFAEYELYEDNLSDVKKTGLLETGDFYENGADENHTLDTDKTRVASNYIISEEFIEI